MGFFGNYRRALDDDWHFGVAGRPVACSHCGSDEFEQSEALLNTRGLTFLGYEWANDEAVVLACRHCGHIEWFLDSTGDIA